ncbi:MAG: hypothetical protein ACR2L9_03375 [Solirubrobacteraceae bacterium]
MVEQQLGAGDVGLSAPGLRPRLEIQHDALIAEPVPEVLQSSIAAAGLGKQVVQLVAVPDGDMSGGGPDVRLTPTAAMILVEHPPMNRHLRELEHAADARALLDMGALPEDPSEHPGLAPVAGALLADRDLDLRPGAAGSASSGIGSPSAGGIRDALGGVGGVVAVVLFEQHHLCAVVKAAQHPWLLGVC